MWTPIQHYFDRIDWEKEDSPVNKRHYEHGRSFYIIRSGIKRDIYELNKIYYSEWNKPIICSKIIPTRSINEAESPEQNMGNLNRIKLFNKLGPFDYIEFMPIYSTVVFGLDIQYPILIHKDEYFLYESFLSKKHDKLYRCTWFNDKEKESLIFIPVAVNYTYAKLAMTIELTNIQFILSATSYIRLISEAGHLRLKDLGYGDIDTVLKLKTLLMSSRYHASEVNS